MRHRLRSFAVLLALAAGSSAAGAQGFHGLSLRLDNDAYNWWKHPSERPDEEYTNGARVTLDGAWNPWWARRLWSGAGRCAGDALLDCRWTAASLGQDIYNPERGRGDVQLDDSRPNAGWLYFGEEVRRVTARGARIASLTFGVTGEPSLASLTQQIAHDVAPEFNRPIDWSEQIEFEPGIIARYEMARLLGRGGERWRAQMIPIATASLGNVLTEATVGTRFRVGRHLRNPWLPAIDVALPEVALHAGVTGRAVARDLFLDGNSFRDSPRVGHRPFVLEQSYGLSATYRFFHAAYEVTARTSTYRGGPAHIWSAMTAGVAWR